MAAPVGLRANKWRQFQLQQQQQQQQQQLAKPKYNKLKQVALPQLVCSSPESRLPNLIYE